MHATRSRQNPEPTTTSEPALYLVLPGARAIRDLKAQLLLALPRVRVAAVLIAPRSEEPSGSDDSPTALVNDIQNMDIAVMISDDADLAKACGTDGLHLCWRAAITADYTLARANLGEDMMIGADAGKSRHDAMVLAETGADYVAFGVPASLKDQDGARARQLELVSWWAALFEIPVVAFDIKTADQADAAIAAGADFIAATLPPNWADQAEREAWLAAFAQRFPPARQNA